MTYNHYMQPNFKNVKIGQEGIPKKIFESKKNTLTEYERNLVMNRVVKPLKRLNGSVDSLIKVMRILQAHKPLPVDSIGHREVYDELDIPRQIEIKHQGNANVNLIVQSQIAQLEAMIKTRLGKKKEGIIE